MTASSLKRNILANYASQLYVTLLGLAMVPVYIRFMGMEAYGLIAFFAMMQVCFQLIDVGIVPTVGRETARFAAGATSALRLRQMLRGMESLFFVIAFAGVAALELASGTIALYWLKVETLPTTDVVHSIELMAVAAGLRWGSELYRGIVGGYERLVWLAQFNAVVATARFILVLPFLVFVGTGPVEFFAYQVLVAAVELAVVGRVAYRCLPPLPDALLPHSWKALRDVAGFSTSMAAATMAWLLVANVDKLLLSSLLPLAEYGRFSLAILAASGVLILAAPVGAALMPRLTSLHARHLDVAVRGLYRQATRWALVVVAPACAVLAFGAEQVMLLWTGDAVLAEQVAPILRLYALGNGLLAMASFAYYLQFAKGDLGLHLLGTGLFVILLVPLLIFACDRFGALGAGWAWLGINLLYFCAWVPVVHARYLPAGHSEWLIQDVLPVAVTALGAASVIVVLPWPTPRILVAAQLVLVSGIVVAAAALASGWVRAELARRLRHAWEHRGT